MVQEGTGSDIGTINFISELKYRGVDGGYYTSQTTTQDVDGSNEEYAGEISESLNFAGEFNMDLEPTNIKQTTGFLAKWINVDDSSPNHLNKRKWSLAKSLAETINEYILYRPDLICEWDYQKNATHRWSVPFFIVIRRTFSSYILK